MGQLPQIDFLGSYADGFSRLSWKLPASHLVSLSCMLMLTAVGSALANPLCSLTKLTLPAKNFPSEFGQNKISVLLSGEISFSRGGDLFTISETMTARLRSARSSLEEIVKNEVGGLPRDRCGSIAIIDGTRFAADGDLTITTTVTVEQWGCLLGVRGQIADGQLGFTTKFHPRVQNEALMLDSKLEKSGSIESHIPDFDPDLSSTVEQRIQSASASMEGAVKKAITAVSDRILRLQAELMNLTQQLEFVYKPKLLSFRFVQEADALVIVQSRATATREGTACKLREVLSEKWSGLN